MRRHLIGYALLFEWPLGAMMQNGIRKIAQNTESTTTAAAAAAAIVIRITIMAMLLMSASI
jgi:succinate dehydrogenase/fumarate reductase cytochrome b subunit